ncbi:MAG: hypothetical protein WBZ36_05710 [Candidatus Nitrosopolaris sp.]
MTISPKSIGSLTAVIKITGHTQPFLPAFVHVIVYSSFGTFLERMGFIDNYNYYNFLRRYRCRHVKINYIKSGRLYSYLQELEVLNIYINAYKIEIDQARKSKLKTFMVETQYWSPESDKVKQFRAFLKTIENKVHEFLKSG